MKIPLWAKQKLAADANKKNVNILLLGGELVRKTNRGVGFNSPLCMYTKKVQVALKIREYNNWWPKHLNTRRINISLLS